MEINKENYKEWLVRYFEDDLNATEKIKADQFINENEWASRELDLLKRTKLKPDMEIRFPDKRLLFRTEEPVVELKKPVVVTKLYRYAALAAAAAVLAFAVIFSIHKPGNKIQTAHSDIHNNIIPSVKQPGNSQAQVVPHTHDVVAPDNVGSNTVIQKHAPVKRDLIANENEPVLKEKQQQPAASEKNSKSTEIQMPQNKDYATNKLPIVKQTDSQAIKPIKEIVSEPVKRVAAINKSEPSIPSKYASYVEDKSVLQSLLDLAHKVSIKKQVVGQQTYYALSVETPDIKINKTIK